MATINWSEEILKRKNALLEDTFGLLSIESILDEAKATKDTPLGEGVKEALDYMLSLGERDGFNVKNVDNLAGHIEYGNGEEIVGVLCHVDVVPAGDGWTSPPFSPEIREGKLFARGAMDDKGPTMAAYYGLKLIKELSLPLKKRVRVIIGTDEESKWRCVKRYFETEEMPKLGFAPDADFPIIHAEKGIADFFIVQKQSANSSDGIRVLYFQSGQRLNMVPDHAVAKIESGEDTSRIQEQFEQFLLNHMLTGHYSFENSITILKVEGEAAHAMEPDKGKNAGLYLSAFLSELSLDKKAKAYFRFIKNFLFQDSRGQQLGLKYSDDITGDLTVNAGVFEYSDSGKAQIGINIRYPVTYSMEEQLKSLQALLETHGFGLEDFDDSKPHHVEKDSVLIQILKKVYEEQTGEEAKLLTIGGGTYARSLKAGVAFGPLFPGRPDVAHQKDEYIIIDDMLKAASIYAQAIFELANKD
ncbi:succinyl-diaminopimelate desuccinylase [Bacillus oleivorans]|uniref:Succinyl-diaminopimelate desuccinylase n=1 Tax=Bacillus oleivorans TaxID=1448271 RepID=A0A285CUS8_9BACI|nr:dipeptidase PepV [Bacillus oleivorans]SNX71321.1 succinyl-diaminopimelate desuccinylase [Bacillus oleivorans]